MALSRAICGAFSPQLPQAIANKGYQQLWRGNSDGPNGAIQVFRKVLVSDPAFPYRWSDLGEALVGRGQIEQARYCFQRSLELAPADPQIALRAANFHFRAGETRRALSLDSAILRQISDYDEMIFSSYFRMGGDLKQVEDLGIGANARAADAFFRFAMRDGHEPELSEIWRWIEGRGFASRPLARAWSSWLLRNNDPAEAVRVWTRHVTLGNGAYRVSNWIDNPGFETGWTNEGFDWQVDSGAGVNVTRDESIAHSGRVSLRVTFQPAENIDFHQVSQRVFLEPGRYRLSAWIRTGDLTTDRGIGLRLLGERAGPALDVSTPTLEGSHDWTEVSREFSVSGPALTARVEIVRRSSDRFDGRPRGTVWIDDVELRRVP